MSTDQLTSPTAEREAFVEALLSKAAEAMGVIRFIAGFLDLAGPQWSEEPGFGSKVAGAFLDKLNADKAKLTAAEAKLRQLREALLLAKPRVESTVDPFYGEPDDVLEAIRKALSDLPPSNPPQDEVGRLREAVHSANYILKEFGDDDTSGIQNLSKATGLPEGVIASGLENISAALSAYRQATAQKEGKDDSSLKCPKCGSLDIRTGHHKPDALAPECNYLACNSCEEQWDHS